MEDISRSETTSIVPRVSSASSQPSVAPTVPGAAKAGTLDSIPVKVVSPAANPSAQLKLDIRAHSAEVEEAYKRALATKDSWHGQIEQAEKELKGISIFSFKQRAVLFKAVSNAQSKFRIFSKFAQLEKYHLDYLDALSKSSLSPHEQHKKYAKFKQAIEKAKT
ncbi:MAG: hypothetical protein FJ390_00240, partial [Verrucomicrobia bacterium]|nr:hypothetical protein [Verrucomicrobiota bacterium]